MKEVVQIIERLKVHHKINFFLLPDHFLKQLNGWTANKNNEGFFILEKNYKFKNFEGSLNFINQASKIAEDENHHPDLKFGWGYANIIIFTHAVKGLTESDFVLAAKIDQLSA